MQRKLLDGQIGLILLVIIGVMVALVMSVASRSLSDTILSRQERESSAAFSVAETGIETAMNAIRDPANGQLNGSLTGLSGFVSGDYEVTRVTVDGLYVKEGETAYLDLSTYVPTLNIFWTKKNDIGEDLNCGTEGSGGSAAAIEIVAIQGVANTAKRSYYKASNCTSFSNGFLNSVDGGANYRSKVNPAYSVPLNTTMIRIKPIYSGTTIAVTGSGLQSQLYLIQSEATGGDARKEIEVKRGLDTPPSVFDFSVFAAGYVVK